MPAAMKSQSIVHIISLYESSALLQMDTKGKKLKSL